MNEIKPLPPPVSHEKSPQGLTEADIHRLFGTMTKAKTKAILQTIRTYCELVVNLHQQQEVETMQALPEKQTPTKETKALSLLPIREAA